MKTKTVQEKFIELLNPQRFRPTTTDLSQYMQPDFSPFESDYDRVVTSASIRRLQDKTQIFPQEKSDFVRRRLTHSIEVAAIGRRIGLIIENRLIKQHLQEWKEYNENYEHAIPTILETAGLVHDIGNPPFGHFGEKTICDFFKRLNEKADRQTKVAQFVGKVDKNDERTKIEIVKSIIETHTQSIDYGGANEFNNIEINDKNDFLNFDGNVQGFRILRKLSLSPDKNSFNLTMPTIATIIKYPYSSTEGNKKNDKLHAINKFGYYNSEREDYKQICDTLHLRINQRHPLAYLLEAADDIANVTSDVEDGYKMGLISLEEIFLSMSELTDKSYENIQKEAILKKISKKKGQDITEIDDSNSDIVIQEFRIQAKAQLIKEVVSIFIDQNNFEAIINASYDDGKIPENIYIGNELLQNSQLRKKLSELQRKTYDSRDVMKSELLGRKVIMELMSMFVSCMFSKDVEKDEQDNYVVKPKTEAHKLYSLISDNYKRIFDCEKNRVPQEFYDRFLLAIDYVSGMTDSYAIELYKELTCG